jgi:hypothetical protein
MRAIALSLTPAKAGFVEGRIGTDSTIQLFLIKEKDGRYAPYTGQTDPDFRWIKGIGGPVFCSPPGWARHAVRLAPFALPTVAASPRSQVGEVGQPQ